MLNNTSYAMNKKTGACYSIVTDTVQTRNRRQVQDFRLNKSKTTQIAESKLCPITEFEASICFAAEKILRGKQAMDAQQHVIVDLYKNLKSRIVEA